MLNVHIEDRGEKEWLVLMHGILADNTQLKKFWDLPYNIYAPDLPGHGKSTPIGRNAPRNAAKKIKKDLRKRGITPYAIIGYSLGGFITLQLLRAGVHPERLVLLGTAKELPHRGVLKRFDISAWARPLAERHEELIAELTDAYRNFKNHPTRIKDTIDIRGMTQYLEDLQEEDYSVECAGFEGSVLVVHGKSDLIIPVSYGRALKNSFLHVTYNELPLSHDVLPYNTTVYEAVQKFLS